LDWRTAKKNYLAFAMPFDLLDGFFRLSGGRHASASGCSQLLVFRFDFRLNTFDMSSRKRKRSVGISGKLSRSPGKQHVAPQNVLLKRRQAQCMPSLFLNKGLGASYPPASTRLWEVWLHFVYKVESAMNVPTDSAEAGTDGMEGFTLDRSRWRGASGVTFAAAAAVLASIRR
jgi:hypothetical protein